MNSQGGLNMQNFDHYIAVDWSLTSMAIARLTGSREKINVHEQPAVLKELKFYLKSLKGSKILAVEESNCSQWLYVELSEFVDKLVVCDPYRNRLLSEGAKNDRIDACKLAQLLKAGLMKEVYHTGEASIYLRKLVSYHQDLVRVSVMAKNQRSALFRSYGLNHKKDKFDGQHEVEKFSLEKLERQIEMHEQIRAEYEEKFSEIVKKSKMAKLLKSIAGVGDIHALSLEAIILDPRRFPTLGHLLSYAGLITHERISGGRSYGTKKPRYHRELKRIVKMATFVALRSSNSKLAKYHEHLIKKGVAPHNARHACSRKLLAYVYGVMKSKKKISSSKY